MAQFLSSKQTSLANSIWFSIAHLVHILGIFWFFYGTFTPYIVAGIMFICYCFILKGKQVAIPWYFALAITLLMLVFLQILLYYLLLYTQIWRIFDEWTLFLIYLAVVQVLPVLLIIKTTGDKVVSTLRFLLHR